MTQDAPSAPETKNLAAGSVHDAQMDQLAASMSSGETPAAPSRGARLRRWAMWGVELLVVAAIAWALIRRRAELAAALDLDALDVAIVFSLCALAAPVRAIELSAVTRALGVTLPFRDALVVTQSATLLNFLPMQAGTLLRARLLKTRYRVSYARYVAVMSSLVLFGVTAAAALGLALLSLGDVGGLDEDVRTGATVAFCALLALAAVALVLPFERLPIGHSRPARWLRDTLGGWREIRTRRGALLVLFLCALCTPLLLGLRYIVCFGALSLSMTPTSSMLLACAILASIPVNVTPGGVGVRELVGTAIGVAAGLDFAHVLAAVTIDRMISLAFSVVAGGASLVSLKRTGGL